MSALACATVTRTRIDTIGAGRDGLARLPEFRQDFYACLTTRRDELFELAEAVLCTEGPVKTLVDLALARLPLPRAAGGRIVLAADVSPWLRPDAATSPDRSFCHTYGRSEKTKHQMIPGWPYSIVAALETGRTSWTALLDATRLEPGADLAAVTADQLRDVVERLTHRAAWQNFSGDLPIIEGTVIRLQVDHLPSGGDRRAPRYEHHLKCPECRKHEDRNSNDKLRPEPSTRAAATMINSNSDVRTPHPAAGCSPLGDRDRSRSGRASLR
ncbi:transposase [Nonomuraea sp. NPDC055795]